MNNLLRLDLARIALLNTGDLTRTRYRYDASTTASAAAAASTSPTKRGRAGCSRICIRPNRGSCTCRSRRVGNCCLSIRCRSQRCAGSRPTHRASSQPSRRVGCRHPRRRTGSSVNGRPAGSRAAFHDVPDATFCARRAGTLVAASAVRF